MFIDKNNISLREACSPELFCICEECYNLGLKSEECPSEFIIKQFSRKSMRKNLINYSNTIKNEKMKENIQYQYCALSVDAGKNNGSSYY